MTGQLELGLAAPKTLRDYDLRDWDWRDCENAWRAWNRASPDERREFCIRIKMPNWPITEEVRL